MLYRSSRHPSDGVGDAVAAARQDVHSFMAVLVALLLTEAAARAFRSFDVSMDMPT